MSFSRNDYCKPVHLSRGGIQGLSKQKGFSTVFVAFFVPIMFLFVLLTADIGQLVFERIKLQQAVDAATLAAADIQAIGMNEIADLNYDAELEYQKFNRYMSSYPPFRDYGEAQSAIDYYTQVFDAIHEYQEDANELYAEWAHEYADAIRSQIAPGAELFKVSGASNDRLIEHDSAVGDTRMVPFQYWVGYCYPYPCYQPHKTYQYPDNPEVIGPHYFPRPGVDNHLMALPGFHMQEVKITKEHPPVTYAAYGLRQRPKTFLVGKAALRNIFPELTVYASAKPTGGDIFGMSPVYRGILKHLKRHDPEPGIPDLERMEH